MLNNNFGEEHVKLIMCPPFLSEGVFGPANAISGNGKYFDLCQYSLNLSEGMLFRFTCCLSEGDHVSSTPNLLAKLTNPAYTD